MTYFSGHAWGGFIVAIMAMWQTWVVMHRVIKAAHIGGYRSGLETRTWGKPVEAVITTGMVLLAVIVFSEEATRPEFVHSGVKLVHPVWFGFFLLAALAIVLRYLGCVAVPVDAEYGFYILGCVNGGILLLHHVGDKTSVDGMMHKLLAYLLFFGTMCFILELNDKTNPIWCLGRTLCYIIHAFWFWTMAVVLYWPPSEVNVNKWPDPKEAHIENNWVAFYFAMNIYAAILVTAIIGAVVSCRIRRMGPEKAPDYHPPSAAVLDATYSPMICGK